MNQAQQLANGDALEASKNLQALYDCRVSFDNIRTRILEKIGLPTTVSRDENLKILVEAFSKKGKDESRDELNALREALLDAIKFNDKCVKVLQLKTEEVSSLLAYVESALSKGNDFSKTFPAFPKHAIEEREKYQIAHLEKHENVTYVYIGIQRVFKERMNIPSSAIKEGIISAGTRLLAISAVALKPECYFDVLKIDHERKTCEIRISGSLREGKGRRKLWMDTAVTYVSNMAKVDRSVGSDNYFPCIRPLYDKFEDDKSDKVTLLDFVTDENDAKRDKKNYDHSDVRSGTYHKAGAEKVGENLRPYNIRKIWNYKSDKNEVKLALEIPGTYDILVSTQYVSECHFDNCVNESEYDFLVGKLYEHLK